MLEHAHAGGRDEEPGVLEILVVLARHKRLVFAFPMACAVLAALIAFALPNIYTGTARVLPPQQGASPLAAALLDNAAGMGGAGALVGQALGLKNPSDLYVGMLQSRSIADAIITRFDLQSLYRKETLVETRKELATATSITAGRDGIITIEVEDEDPKRAADMANAYVESLDRLTQDVAVTTAGRQRVFLEKQLRQSKEKLAEAEAAMRSTQEKTGLISVTEQGKAMIESVASLRALVAAKQVQLAALRTGTTERNPDYIRTSNELAGLQRELAKLERSAGVDAPGVIPSAGRIPETGLEFARRMRDVQYYQTLFELIAKQYEIARAQEAAEAGLIQVLDRAVVPDRKTRPYRLLIALVTGLIAGLLGLIAAFGAEARRRAQADERQALLLAEIEGALPALPWKRKLPAAP